MFPPSYSQVLSAFGSRKGYDLTPFQLRLVRVWEVEEQSSETRDTVDCTFILNREVDMSYSELFF